MRRRRSSPPRVLPDGSRLCCFALCFGGLETAAWLLLVPGTLAWPTFLFLNVLAAGMFCVGFASAANGLPQRSMRQIMLDLEHGPSARANR